ERLLQALEFLGTPLPAEKIKAVQAAIKTRDAVKLQELLDPHVLIVVNVNPESRVKAKRGPANVRLQEGGYTPVLLKVVNESTVTKPLNISSPQGGAVYASPFSKKYNDEKKVDRNNFLDVAMYTKAPMSDKLSGLKVEYALATVYSKEPGKRGATFQF